MSTSPAGGRAPLHEVNDVTDQPPRPRGERRATYRLQLRRDVGFDRVAELCPYLAELGVSHVYLSPVLEARAGSTHGYDVVDPTTVSHELGGEAAFERMCAALGAHDLGLVVDVVPNHMAVSGPENRWWWDVLENGPASVYARHFDVDWAPAEAKLQNTVLLPILGDHFGRVLEAGEIHLERGGPDVIVRYYEHVMPTAPRSLPPVLADAAARCGSDDLAFLADAYENLPSSTDPRPESRLRRHRDKQVLRHLLGALLEDPGVAAAVDDALADLVDDADRLQAFLDAQNYRLARWRTAAREVVYRRFFDVNELVGLRAEDPEVFADTHGLLLDWLRDGVVDGLRIDHVDGLRDPLAYLERLRSATPDGWIVVEKILAGGELLPGDWPVDGTTGYDFLNVVSGLFVDPSAEGALTALYEEVVGAPVRFLDLAEAGKRGVLGDALAADLTRLTGRFIAVCERERRYRDFTRHELHEVLRETLVALDRYRTYVRPDRRVTEVHAEDEACIERAVARATLARPDLDGELFELLRRVLLGRIEGDEVAELRARFQQVSPPVMAKGVEDTAFYRYNRFVALNEVGGEPDRFGVGVEEFHRFNEDHGGGSMLATSTHDTKRSEDVRARLAVLSEVSDRWAALVRGWHERNARLRVDGAPDPNLEHLLYQTLVGAHPLSLHRTLAFLEKAAREAKERTSWTDPDERYEAGVRAFTEALLADVEFRAELDGFVREIAPSGYVNSLAMTLLKLTCPGVPDLYQGTELWDLSLVDPDNRRPVDVATRVELLDRVQRAGPEDVLADLPDGSPKLFLVQRVLGLRRERPELFAAPYRALEVQGTRAAHVVAFARGDGLAVAVPRLVHGLGGRWGRTVVALPGDGSWRDAFSGEVVRGGRVTAARLFGRFPVALLVAV